MRRQTRLDSNPDEELQDLFPQYEVVADSFQAEGNSYTVYRLLKEGELALLIQPWEGLVSEVMVLDPTILGPYGVHVGATLESLGDEARSQVGRCFFAAEGQERVFCELNGPTRAQLTFATDGLKLEPEKPVAVETLAGRVIQGLRWLPPR